MGQEIRAEKARLSGVVEGKGCPCASGWERSRCAPKYTRFCSCQPLASLVMGVLRFSLALAFALCVVSVAAIQCKDEMGAPVDWWYVAFVFTCQFLRNAASSTPQCASIIFLSMPSLTCLVIGSSTSFHCSTRGLFRLMDMATTTLTLHILITYVLRLL